MKLNIGLIIAALLLLLIAFNLKTFQYFSTESDYIDLYDKLNALAWSVFSLSALRMAKAIKTTGRPPEYARTVKIMAILCELFLSLSVCPLVNEFFGNAIEREIGNYIYGGIALVYYIVIFVAYTVKLYERGGTK